MKRRCRGLGLGLLALGWASLGQAAAPTLSTEDNGDVSRAIDYLRGLTTATARFVQTDARGGRSEGTLVLQRPGRARFDYDPPSGLMIASDGAMVTVVDTRLKTRESFPLGMTPLGLFLSRDIRLDKGVQVTRVEHGPDGLTIAATEGRRKVRGAIALKFATSPLALTGWTLTDARGGVVIVRLHDLRPTPSHPPGFFNLPDPRPKPDPDGIR